MSTKPERSGSRVSENAGPAPFDHQQKRLLSILARRAAEPVTYDELRATGIELPASLVSELELAGLDIERCQTTGPDGRSVRAVHLRSTVKGIAGPQDTGAQAPDPSPRRAPVSSNPPRPAVVSSNEPVREPVRHASVATIPGPGAVRLYRGSLRRALALGWVTLAHRRDAERFAVYTPRAWPRNRPSVRLLAPLALLVAAAITAAVVVAATSAGKTRPPLATRHKLSAAPSARAGARWARAHGTGAASRARAARRTASGLGASAAQRRPQGPRAGSPAASAGNVASPALNTTAVTSPSSGTNAPSAVVQAFYEAAAQHRYAAAWALADPNMRGELGSYAAFEDQMTPVRSIMFHQVDALQHASNTATVAVRTTSVQTDRTQWCSGTVRTVQQAGAWLLDGISIHCT